MISMVEKYFKQSDVAERIGVQPDTVKVWRKQGKIKAVRTPGGRYRYPESEINRILSNTTISRGKETLEIKIPHSKRIKLEKQLREKTKRKNITLEEGITLALEAWVKKGGKK